MGPWKDLRDEAAKSSLGDQFGGVNMYGIHVAPRDLMDQKASMSRALDEGVLPL